MKKTFLFLSLYCLIVSYPICYAQPVISVSNVGWGWFTLNMSNSAGTVTSTRWLIRDLSLTAGYDTVLDTRWIGYPTPNIADQRDLFSKEIVGCKSNTMFEARAQYFNGSWSSFSNAITFTTSAEPVLSGTDTIHVVLWGHSLINYGEQWGVHTDIFFSRSDDPYNVVGPILETQLRRYTGLKISVINRGVSGSQQHEWFRADQYNRAYWSGHEYSNSARYPIAIFFHGVNDYPYTANEFGNDMHWIIDTLISRGIKVMYNSIHYVTPAHYPSGFEQFGSDCLSTWNTVMNSYSGSPNVKRGVNLYNLFQADTARYLIPFEDPSNVSVHLDRSEGPVALVNQLIPLLNPWVPIGVQQISTNIPENFNLSQNYPNPFNPSTKIRFEIPRSSIVQLNIYDITGREITRLVDQQLNAGLYETEWNAGDSASGIYIYELKTEEYTESKKMVIVK